jgi:UDP-N-acetylglucosamine diphosphorylase / glucose-1-phosphate thymidylyltransferase / UDP-N-acetylgalactosamine diphosphorylase / glucosamine-1-phosphate N-acetyltransferase / galactosamine-1-phosphate N-acetyltransferase
METLYISMQAVILAAGKGLRLRPYTDTQPKPLVDIAGQPLLHYALNALPDSISEVIIVVGYLGEQILAALGNEWEGRPIRYVEQPELKGTGDALFCAKDLLEDKFLVINGDDLYSKADLTELTKHSYSILAWQAEEPYQFGLGETPDGHLAGFDPTSALTNCGAYFLNQDFFADEMTAVETHAGTEYSLPHTLVALAKKHPVAIVKAHEWFQVGTPEQLEIVRERKIKKQP